MRKGLNSKLKYVLALLLFAGAMQVPVHAAPHHKKHKKTDSIAIPRDEFVEILADAVRKRRKQMREEIRLQILQTKASQQHAAANGMANAGSDADYMRRIERLEDQLHQLTLLLIQEKAQKDNSTPVNYLPGQQPVQNLTGGGDTKVVVDDSALAREVNRLKALNNQINQQPKQVARAKSPYAGQISEVFFANNKYHLSAEGIAKVNAVATLLKADENLDVMIKGFASKVGGTMHNQELSLKRSDVVKQAFISKGIATGRVLTTYHGEDFSSRSEAESRRVDIILLDNRE